MTDPKPARKIVLASRASQLAQVQTNFVRDVLSTHFPSIAFDVQFLTTEGDRNQSQALYVLGGKSLWTKDLEVLLLDGTVDMLVHCFKDVPTILPEGCEIGAVLEREDPVDSLVVKKGLPYKRLEELPDGSVVGTSSVRRVAQLKRHFPKLAFQDVRGNLNTRLSKLDSPDSPYSALVLAKAGMVRMGWGDRLTSDLQPPILYPAVSQGALAVEIRSSDTFIKGLCSKLTHTPTLWCCLAERACLRVLEGGCSVPVGARTVLSPQNQLEITACVTEIGGAQHVEHAMVENVVNTDDAESMGVRMAQALIEAGAKTILDEIAKDREKRAGEVKAADEVAKIESSMQAQSVA